MIEKLSAKKVKDYLKNIIDCPNWHIGKSDSNEEQSITIYTNKRNLAKISDYKKLQTYGILPITMLIRWTKNYDKAEIKANEIYELLDCSSFFIEDYMCNINCLYNAPIDLGTDEKNVYEFSIELDLLYKKGEKV